MYTQFYVMHHKILRYICNFFFTKVPRTQLPSRYYLYHHSHSHGHITVYSTSKYPGSGSQIFFQIVPHLFYIIFRGNGSIRGTKPNSSMGMPYSLNLASYERTASLCNCVILSNSCCTSRMV